jgi:serine protease Do
MRVHGTRDIIRRGHCRRILVVLPLTLAAGLLGSDLCAQTQPNPSHPTSVSDPLHQFSHGVEALVARVSPSVVQILVTGYGPREGTNADAGLEIGKQQSLGSGVVLDADGYVITNAHVVAGAQRVEVVVPTPSTNETPVQSLVSGRGHTLEGRIVGIASELDLALLKVEAEGLAALRIASYDQLRQGEIVFAFGNPDGLWNSVTMGVVSAVARQRDPDDALVYIQTDAPINPGNSGGPLVNVDGELVGLNTFILSESGGNQGLGFAIPSAIVSMAYAGLRQYGHVHRGEIGLNVQAITPDLASGLELMRDKGVIVSDVVPGGPADVAGLKVQDVILAIDDKPVQSVPSLLLQLYTRNAGEHVKIGVLRGSQALFLNVTVAEVSHELEGLPDLADPDRSLVPALGVLGVEIDGTIAQKLPGIRVPSGVIVAARARESRRVDIPLAAGDVIHAVNGILVSTLDGLRATLGRLKRHSAVVLQIERAGKLRFIAFQSN